MRPLIAALIGLLALALPAKAANCHGPDAAQCLLAAAKDANSQMNEVYNRLFKALAAKKPQETALQNAQNLWLQFRSADCAAARDVSGGGEVAYYTCIEAETRQRTLQLGADYGRKQEPERRQ
jgi:uncharacterized protein YecT (DUF1311 family)